ncbi:MAG TPA: glycosyltransferase [Candidatus Didemnitutus sp.]|nr:glycosyltransferase [Candidatus Didemnitutus sp.]
MPRTLYITTELPYFPGQGGLMALHVRHLSQTGMTGVVGPRHPHQPEGPLQNLRETVQRSYWWPEFPLPGDLPGLPESPAESSRWLGRLPAWVRWRLLRRLTGLSTHSEEALAWRVALAQIAPKILEALDGERWNAALLSQSTSAAWLRFLPASLARCLFLHDIRSDYLARAPASPSRRRLRRVRREERAAARSVQSLAVISELDRRRALALLHPPCPTAVAPVCVDTDYFAFEPPTADAPPVILFTGHLAHPPNVDAVVHFLEKSWPTILAAVPAAQFRIVGLQPDPAVLAAVARARQTELIPNAPDIRPHARAARVMVIPMRYGGGVRQKMVEAWAIGLPVVSTPMGAEGLDARHEVNCWLAAGDDAFSREVVRRLQTPAPLSVLQAARAQAVENHRSEKSSPQLARQIEVATRRGRDDAPKVLFDLRWLNPGQVGGVEQMTRELIDELGSYDRVFDYRFLASARVCRDWRFPSAFRHRLVEADGERMVRAARRDTAINALAASLRLPLLATPETRALEWYTQLDFTVVHGLSSSIHPDLRRFPSVVTVHDLQHLHLPHFFSADDILTREREYGASCRLASHVICTSEFTRQDVHAHYGIPLEKMTTIWNLPPKLTGSRIDPGAARGLLQDMGVKPPFLFYPAHPWLHKNHRGLLQAMALLHGILPKEYTLVLTSQPFPNGHPAAPLMEHPRLRGRVRHLGYRSPSEIAALYAMAEALVFPSLFEGFGLPIVEAMQQGCPIVCGAHSSLPEIAGQAAHYAEVASPEALASAILTITRDRGLRSRLRENAVANLRRFDRRALADKTRAVYAAVHREHFS